MKTTIEISDALLEQAKRRAAERGTALRALVEEGLREVIQAKPGAPFVLRDASVDGRGLQADVPDGSWERTLEVAYEGRGGLIM